MKFSILLAIGMLVGCSTVQTVNDYCSIAKPIVLQTGEAKNLSDATAREILAHNQTWQKVCHK